MLQKTEWDTQLDKYISFAELYRAIFLVGNLRTQKRKTDFYIFKY